MGWTRWWVEGLGLRLVQLLVLRAIGAHSPPHPPAAHPPTPCTAAAPMHKPHVLSHVLPPCTAPMRPPAPCTAAVPPFPQAVGEVIGGLAQGNMATMAPKARVAAAEKWISLEHVRKVRGGKKWVIRL